MCVTAGSSAFVTAQSLVEVSKNDEKLPSIPESNKSCAHNTGMTRFQSICR